MSYGLFLPRRWTRQPQGPVEIDWGNPVTRGLQFFFTAAAGPRNIVNNRIADVWASDIIVTGDARSFNHNTTNYLEFSLPNVVSSSGSQHSIFSRCRVKINGTGPSGIFYVGNPADEIGSGMLRFEVWQYITPVVRGRHYRLYVTAGTNGTDVTGKNNPASVVGVMRGNAEHDFFVNGNLVETSTTSVYMDWSAGVVKARVGFYDGRVTGGSTEASAYWTRALSADEAKFVSSPDVWSLLKPRRPVIYSFPSGGIVIPTLSLPGVQDVTTTGARPKVTLTF